MLARLNAVAGCPVVASNSETRMLLYSARGVVGFMFIVLISLLFIGLLVIETEFNTPAELAYANVAHAVDSPVEKLVQHLNADKAYRSRYANELVDSVALAVNPRYLDAVVAVDIRCRVVQCCCFHVSVILRFQNVCFIITLQI